jgi:hypothetical protein
MDACRWLAALLLVPALVACSDDAKSDGKEPPTSVSPKPTESEKSQGPVEPELPDAAMKPTKPGAIAFVEHYWATVHYAQTSGDTEGLAKLASTGCELCQGGIRGLRKVHAKGGRFMGPPARVASARASLSRYGPEGQKFLAANVRHTLVTSRTVAFYGKGDPRNRTFKAGKEVDFLLVVWQDDARGWLITDWRVE